MAAARYSLQRTGNSKIRKMETRAAQKFLARPVLEFKNLEIAAQQQTAGYAVANDVHEPTLFVSY